MVETLSQRKRGRFARTAGSSRPAQDVTVRRCRPLLGTFVEIAARGPEPTELDRHIDRAFQKIERVQGLMSIHDPESELSRVNAIAWKEPVTVSDEIREVLSRGLQLAQESDGAFDFTIAGTLAQWGLLPSHIPRPVAAPGGWNDVILMPHNRVRFLKPLAIDVGGFAKGFAVDLAAEFLRGSEVAAAMVNAGGDLRAFGIGWPAVHLRHPTGLHALPDPIQLLDAALATSSPFVTRCVWRGQAVSHLVDPRRGTPLIGDVSVTVRAPECWLADGLTKVVLNDPRRAETLLALHNAEAFVLSA